MEAEFAGLTLGGVSYDAEQSRAIIEYARHHGITEGRAAELLAEINGWPRPRNIGRPRGRTDEMMLIDGNMVRVKRVFRSIDEWLDDPYVDHKRAPDMRKL